MQLRDIIPKSTLAIISTLSGPESLSKARLFFNHNRDVLEAFDNIRILFNYTNTVLPGLILDYTNLYKTLLPKATVTVRSINAGHMRGTIDLDETCLESAKFNESQYLWKASDDTIMHPPLLDVEVEANKGLYYIPGFSYETLTTAGSIGNLIEFYEDYWFAPQTNFFIIDTTKVPTLYGEGIDEKWDAYLMQKEKYVNLKPWDMQFPDGIKFGCEDLLGAETKHLSKQNLLNREGFEELATLIKFNREPDPSHKNIYLSRIGVCHFHNYKDNAYII